MQQNERATTSATTLTFAAAHYLRVQGLADVVAVRGGRMHVGNGQGVDEVRPLLPRDYLRKRGQRAGLALLKHVD